MPGVSIDPTSDDNWQALAVQMYNIAHRGPGGGHGRVRTIKGILLEMVKQVQDQVLEQAAGDGQLAGPVRPINLTLVTSVINATTVVPEPPAPAPAPAPAPLPPPPQARDGRFRLKGT
jgi:hypothetical protein